MKKPTSFAAVGFLLTLACLTAAAAREKPEAPGDDAQYVVWPWPVAFSEMSSPKVEDLANKLERSIRPGLKIGKSKQNPVCCLWLEIDPWRPNPSQKGYIIVVQEGGGRITACDEEQLEAAVDALIKVSRRDGEQAKLPLGLLTNYPIIGGRTANSRTSLAPRRRPSATAR